MIPFVILEAHPDYKRPSIEHDFGVVREEEIDSYFLDRVCNFILDRTNEDYFKCEYDIQKFFDTFFDESYMANSPWEALIFINGEWENKTPSNEKIWEHIQLLKLQEIEDKEEQDKFKQIQEDELETDDKIILTKMRNFFEKMLEENPLPPSQIESLQKMNEIQQLSSLFDIYMTPDNFSKHKDLFFLFLNLLVKFIQKEIEEITKKMEKEDSEELSKQLNYILEIYSNTLLIKQTFNI